MSLRGAKRVYGPSVRLALPQTPRFSTLPARAIRPIHTPDPPEIPWGINRMEAVTPSTTVARSAPRAAAAKMAMLAASIAFGLLVGEIGLRLAGYSPAYVNAMGSFHESNPVTGHRGKPGFRGRFKTPEFDVLIVHNDAGFRRQEFQKPDSAGGRRLAVYGDSFVWGWGVEQGEVFTDQLSRRMPDWRIENYGINGTGTLAQYELFAAERRDRLQPGDVVLLAFYGNDLTDNVEGTRSAKIVDGQIVPQPVRDPSRGGWQRTLQESSYLFNYVSYVANRWQLERRIRRAEAKAIAAAEAAKAQAPNPEVERRASPTATSAQAVVASPGTAENNATAGSATNAVPSAVSAASPPTDDAAVQIAIERHYLALAERLRRAQSAFHRGLRSWRRRVG